MGSIFGGPLADRLGRKMTIMISDLLFTIGAIIMAFASTISVLILGRTIVGLGVGCSAMIVPIYLSEVSPKKIRGTIVTYNLILITFA